MKPLPSANIVKAILMIIVPLTMFSCTSPKYVYSPETANLLEIKGRHDMKAAVSYSTAGNGTVFGGDNRQSAGLDLQGAYAAGKRVVLRADAYKKWERNHTEAADSNGVPLEKNSYRKSGISLSAGIYNFSKSKNSSLFQLNGGIGLGKTSFTTYSGDPAVSEMYYSADYFKFFLQPSIVVKASKYYTATLANTFSLMNYSNVHTVGYPDIKKGPLGFIDTRPSFFSEFVFQNEFGFSRLDGLRFQLQIGASKLYTRFSSDAPTPFRDEQYDYHKAWLAVGVAADLKELFKKKQ